MKKNVHFTALFPSNLALITRNAPSSVNPSILFLYLVSKAESSDKNLTGIFMNKLGLKEPGFENRITFSKKAGEPQKLLRFYEKFALVNVSQSRTVKQAFKTV